MFRSKITIHLLVSLMLILNGFGAATASAVMAEVSVEASAEFQGDMALEPQIAAMQSGCHEHDFSIPSSPSPWQSHSEIDAVASDPAPGETDSPDCCKDGGCGCGRAHQSQIVLTAAFLVTQAIAPASMQREQFAHPLSPSLSRPVRPPIA